MKMGNQTQLSPFIIVVFVLCTGYQQCHSSPWIDRIGLSISKFAFGNRLNWRHLRFKGGDIIHCNIITPFPYHVMLATSSSTIAHMMGDISSGKGTLREESWSDFHGWASPQMEHCWINSEATLPDAVERARKDVSFHGYEKIHYSFLMCNCEHWVRYWAHGEAYSKQSGRATDSKCDVGRQKTNLTVYRNPGQGVSDREMVVHIVERKCNSWSMSWNKQISKMALGDLCVRVYDATDCRGQSICLCQSDSDLSLMMKASGRSWNNEVSSVSLCGYKEDIKTVALLFERRNYLGAIRKIILVKNECLTFFENDWWNDEVTSVQVTYGCLEYFTGFYCSGISYELSGNESYVGKGYDDQISSIRPC